MSQNAVLGGMDAAVTNALAEVLPQGKTSMSKIDMEVDFRQLAHYTKKLYKLKKTATAVFLSTDRNRQQATGNRQQATGNRQQATGNRQQATGNRQLYTHSKNRVNNLIVYIHLILTILFTFSFGNKPNVSQGLMPFGHTSFVNQQPRPKGTGYVVLIRYLHSGFYTFFNRPRRAHPKGRGIKPLSTNKSRRSVL
jgi:uncharacterized protein YjbJ (UPF0337 family)